jgi:23S rRNA (adenine1618-N6)-methyltransferase
MLRLCGASLNMTFYQHGVPLINAGWPSWFFPITTVGSQGALCRWYLCGTMTEQKSPPPLPEKDALHPRNRHVARYDFARLVAGSPELGPFVRPNQYQDDSIDFADPAAVKALNQALLKHFYGVAHWDIPAGYLCPPIPGRADYLHYLADLLADSNGGVIPRGKSIKVLDVGMGANCIYPIIGHREYGWRFVGSDIDPVAVRVARQLVSANSVLANAIDCRLQPNSADIFRNVVRPGEVFDLTLCNPPFHASAAEAEAGSRRKWQQLGAAPAAKPALNFGGQAAELWCQGGEEGFVRRMVAESARLPTSCFWFTSLISKKDSLYGVNKALQKAGARDVRTVAMSQGQKVSRFVAWTFLDEAQQQEWRAKRF